MDAVDTDFRRNFVVVLGVHLALVAALWLVSSRAKTPPPEQITWLDGGGLGVAAPAEEPAPPAPPEPVAPTIPESAPPPPDPEPPVEATTPPEPPPAPKQEDLAPKPAPTPE